MKEVFQEIYLNNAWGSAQSRSGQGSELQTTILLTQMLPAILKGLGIRFFIDAPCGDFNWMRTVSLPVEKYLGVDVVPELIQLNNVRYGNDRASFAVLDITKEPLPYSDLIFSRDCLQHLDNASCVQALQNFRASGAKYLLTSSHHVEENADITPGGFRPLNLRRAPFNLPEPMLLIPDHDGFPKHLCLWNLDSF
jgi:hypothetical protein